MEYPEEATELDGLLPNDDDFDDEEYRLREASRRETLILIAIGVVIVLLVISLTAIICKSSLSLPVLNQTINLLFKDICIAILRFSNEYKTLQTEARVAGVYSLCTDFRQS